MMRLKLSGDFRRPGRRALTLLAVLATLSGPVAAASAGSTVSGDPAASAGADLILTGARVWTGAEARPWAEAVAVRGERIVAVGPAEEVLELQGPETRVLELDRLGGGFVAPGFIDNHTHFDRAGALLLGVNLLEVSDAEGLVREVEAARDRLPAGSWITGGDWGAYEAWGQGSSGRQGEDGAAEAGSAPFDPDRSLLDPVTPDNPVLLSRWDGEAFVANGRALEAAGAECSWEGVECREGEPTGRLSAAAAGRVREAVPPKPMARRLAEARAGLERLASHGVTTIHDITGPEQMRVFQELRRRGELTVRVYARPTLDRWDELAAAGVQHGFGDSWLKIGGLKGFVDGIMGNSSARFYEPYRTSGERGSWRDMMRPEGNMLRLLEGADAAGHWPQVHAIGDEAIDTLLDLFEHVIEENGPHPLGERRFRVIHTQVLRGPEVARRMARLGVIAEVQPYHAIDDMRWMEERIGERSRWAYAFKTLEDAGVLLSFGSDWPGTNASWYPASPVLGIYAAVARKTLEGEPEGGWYPRERVSLETALRAYTVNNAWAEGEEDEKGTLAPGKLADLVVLDRDPFAVEADALKDLEVVLTMVGGRIVHEFQPARAGAQPGWTHEGS
ncbi:MAG: amidohydrolase [Thermoanaerobaculia bacterium]